jgi:hypothetical protein
MYPLRPHREQYRLWTHPARFKTVPAGRRSGKTELAKRKVIKCATALQRHPDGRYFLGAPTRDQAKRIFWEDLKRMVHPWWLLRRPSESELCITLKNYAQIWVVGLDVPQRMEGVGWDGGIIDEFGNIKPEAWDQNIRPALSDRLGWAWLIGVPEGRNHYYLKDKAARTDETGEWASFHWKSADILPASEIEAAARELDPLTFQQEYEASFLNFEGRAYYPFGERIHAKWALPYVPAWPIGFCFDFNVEPGIAVVVQEIPAPSEDGLPLLDRIMTGCIGEVYIPQNSNTPAVCRKLIQDWGDHPGDVYCYGDATGGARGTAKVKGTDWDIIRDMLLPVYGDRLHFEVPRENPRERERINSVNSRLMSTTGEVRMMVDPQACPHLVLDFEGTVLLKGGSGEIDKKKDPSKSHMTDALGYYIWRRHPIRKLEGGMAEVKGL